MKRLSISEQRTLGILSETGRPMESAEIADLTGLSRQMVIGACVSLENKCLVQRHRKSVRENIRWEAVL